MQSQFSSVQSFSHVQLFVTPWTEPHQASLSITNSQDLLKLTSILHISWPKYWSFSFIISPSNEYSQLTSFMIDRFDLLAVQGTVKCLLQHHDSKVSILQYSAFFMVQLSHPYITGKSIALRSITLPNLIHLLCHLNTLLLPICSSSVLSIFPLILINHPYFINQGEVLV